MMSIVIRGLTKRFGNNYALQNVNLKIPKGATFGLLGSNGAGKTTLLSILSGLHRPTYGQILIDGVPFDKTPISIRRRISLMPQNAQFPLNETPIRYLVYLGRLRGMSKSSAHIQAISLLHSFGLEQSMDKSFSKLSNGMLKLVNIAQSFLGNPEVIFLDEPIAGLDPKMAVKVMRFLQENHAKKTYIICSHHLSIIEKACSHVAVLHEGHLMIESSIKHLRDEDHILNVQLKKLNNSMVKDIQALQYVRNVFVDELHNALRIVHQKDVMAKVVSKIEKHNSKIISISRGEPLDDFFLKYL
jgi:ABC-2 type transport system ATP-binding protein